MPEVFRTLLGSIQEADSLSYMREYVADSSVDLVITSPPFALLRKKDYGNKAEHEYVDWFEAFGREFHRILKPSGSVVIDIGGSWIPEQPTRSLYHFELLIMLCRKVGFNLAQEFYWWNPSKLPTPAEWVNIRRIRAKDAVNSVYWLSKTPWPKASNRRILVPYSESMKDLLKNGYDAKLRPSGHDISEKFSIDNKAAIPPNLLAIPNTESNSYYIRYCKANNLKIHPARFPAALPEFFLRMLTDEGDIVLDPFAGSSVVGAVCERLNRKWVCCETEHDYNLGAVGRFEDEAMREQQQLSNLFYKINHPGCLWNENDNSLLSPDGGRVGPVRKKKKKKTTTEDENPTSTASETRQRQDL